MLEEDGSDVWRADDAVAVIRSGGVGVIPTDTGYDDARAQSRVSCGPPARPPARTHARPPVRSSVRGKCDVAILEGFAS